MATVLKMKSIASLPPQTRMNESRFIGKPSCQVSLTNNNLLHRFPALSSSRRLQGIAGRSSTPSLFSPVRVRLQGVTCSCRSTPAARPNRGVVDGLELRKPFFVVVANRDHNSNSNSNSNSKATITQRSRAFLDRVVVTFLNRFWCVIPLPPSPARRLPLFFGAVPSAAFDGIIRMLVAGAKFMRLIEALLRLFSGATDVALATLPLMANTLPMAKILPLLMAVLRLLPLLVAVLRLLQPSSPSSEISGDKAVLLRLFSGATDVALATLPLMANTPPMAKILPLPVAVLRLLPLLVAVLRLLQPPSPSVEISGDKAACEPNNTTALKKLGLGMVEEDDLILAVIIIIYLFMLLFFKGVLAAW